MCNVSNCQVCQQKFNANASSMPWKTWLFFGWRNLQRTKRATCKELLNLLFTLLEGAVGKDRFQSRGSNLRNVWSTDLLHADHLKAPFPPGRTSAIMLIPPLHGLLLSCPTPKLRTKGGIVLSKWNKRRDYKGLAEGKLAISFFSMIYL